MTTDNVDTEVTAKPRDLSELLKLKTFQGMSDEEIQLIIDWNVENARFDEVTKVRMASEIESMNSTVEVRNSVAKEANDILKQLLSKPLELDIISDNDATEV